MKVLQKKVKKYLKDRGWDNLRPGDVAKSIAIESSELLEIFQWSNPSLSEFKKDKSKLKELKKELADVLIYCLDMAVLLNIDAGKAIRTKLKLIKKKYPAKLMRTEVAGESYWKIKKKYRKKGI